MASKLIHISDIHFRESWKENHGVVMGALISDIETQMSTSSTDTFYAILSGDIVQSADDQDSYKSFLSDWGTALDGLGIPSSHRLCVPGNHDVSRARIEESLYDHEGIVSQNLKETRVNDYLKNCNAVFSEKFNAYRAFESMFSDMPVISASLGGYGYKLDDFIGVYCLNSAIFSSGGLHNPEKETLVDKNRLVIETRNLHSWVKQCDTPCKVLVMHHPLDWLVEWASNELNSLLYNEFSLFLSGHSHDQKAYHLIADGKPFVQLHAPPLFTTKEDMLGYSIISICPTRYLVSEVVYRQWVTKYQRFVAGVNFSGTENGKLSILDNKLIDRVVADSSFDPVDQYLTSELEDALKAFSTQPKIWVDPIISETQEIDPKAREAKHYSVADIMAAGVSTVIQAPGQFGLSCLARYFAQQAWRRSPRSRWVCLDVRGLKPNRKYITKEVEHDLTHTGQKESDLNCIILDSWKASDINSIRILKTVCEIYTDIPVFVMQTMDDQIPISPVDDETIGRSFRVLHLWSLSREHIRSVVARYNDVRHIGEEDKVTTRVISDIDTLNIHRTPLNCLTVLKACEADFDENPVNRTEILHRVLFILFNIDSIPRYKTKPDMKDCEHVIGCFVEDLIRNNVYTFTRESFLETLKAFCEKQAIAVDVDILFDLLYNARILVPFGSNFCFKFTSWLYYFAAHRMHHDPVFADFILNDMHYSRFPEIMEFYTGIDRQRNDAVRVLIKDLQTGVATIQEKCGLPKNMNPLPFLEWKPSQKSLEKMQSELRDGVAESNLPPIIKDRYTDRNYDRSQPYSQSVRDILTGHSMGSLMLTIIAASRALRNSDYVNLEDRQALLSAIMDGWRQVSQILFVLLPPLVERGHASFDGAWFALRGEIPDDIIQRFYNILTVIPDNVVSWYQDDLYSPKMSPLIERFFKQESDSLIKHELILLQIAKRPRGWKEIVQSYIHSIPKSSFYLGNVDTALRLQYKYSFSDTRELKDLEYLIKMVAVKHQHGVKKPKIKAVNKVPDSILPDRKI